MTIQASLIEKFIAVEAGEAQRDNAQHRPAGIPGFV